MIHINYETKKAYYTDEESVQNIQKTFNKLPIWFTLKRMFWCYSKTKTFEWEIF